MKAERLFAPISEIFSSLQGEGPRIGERHLFIRFGACHMACAYCDESWKKSRNRSLVDVMKRVIALEKLHGPHACVSLTGGEPLLFTEFLRPLCQALRNQNFQILLETNGVLWRPLSKVMADCDIIAMDLKLASVTRQGDLLEEHRKFLRIAKKKELYIKMVLSQRVRTREFMAHLRMVASVAPSATVFLQPISQHGRTCPAPAMMRLLDRFQQAGSRLLPSVRVGIQLHKVLNIR